MTGVLERIELVLGRQEKTFTAAMLWDDAPRTCEAIATMLADGAIEGLTYHAIYSGHEFYVYCPPVARSRSRTTSSTRSPARSSTSTCPPAGT